MATRLDETFGTMAYDNLISSTNPSAELFMVTVAKGDAEVTLKRGTVLALDSNGKMEVLGSGSGTANAVLADDVTVGTAADAVAVAYRNGHFNKQALIVATGYTMTAADKEALRSVGILITDAIE